MKKIVLGGLLLSFWALSCKKSNDTVVEADKFMTITANSQWIYDVTNNLTSTTTADTVTATSADTSVNGRSYRKFSHKNGGTDYYNITGNSYYQYRNTNGAGGLDIAIEDLYLKDNANVGDSWSQSVNVDVGGGLSIPVTFTNSVLEKAISKTVNGITYNNVYHLKTDISASGVPAGTIVSNIQNYYAPKVGLIEGDYSIQISLASIDINTTTKLKSSSLQ